MRIDESLYLSNQNQLREGSSTIDKDGFLKILMAQLQNQDPLSPLEDKDFIAQMTSFTQLEQMMNMSSQFESLVEQSSLNSFLHYSSLIGKSVTYFNYDGNEFIGEVQAKVQSVIRTDHGIVLRLDNGEDIYSEQVFQVDEMAAAEDEVNEDESSD